MYDKGYYAGVNGYLPKFSQNAEYMHGYRVGYMYYTNRR